MIGDGFRCFGCQVDVYPELVNNGVADVTEGQKWLPKEMLVE
jgi:hypothetical protein